MINSIEDIKRGTVIKLMKDVYSRVSKTKLEKGDILLLTAYPEYSIPIKSMSKNSYFLINPEDLKGSREIIKRHSTEDNIFGRVGGGVDLMVIFPFLEYYPGDIVSRDIDNRIKDYTAYLDNPRSHSSYQLKFIFDNNNIDKEYKKEAKEINKKDLSVDDIDKITIKDNKIYLK